MGRQEIRPRQVWDRWRTCSAISLGPVAQFRPITGTPSASTMAVAAAMSVPTSMVPVVSMVDLDHQRQLAAPADEGVAAAVDGGLDLQRILAGLDQQRVRAAGDQPLGLDGEGGLQLAVGDVAEAGQLGAGADGADDEALAAVAGEGLHGLAGEAGGALVDLERPRLEAELAQRDGRAAEAVGLDRVGAGLEVADMDARGSGRGG